MQDKINDNTYPGFSQPAQNLSKFIAAGDIFTLMLKDGTIVHYTASHKEKFTKLLIDHDICDIKSARPYLM